MNIKYPMQVICGENKGVSRSSQALIGSVLPSSAMGMAGIKFSYNVTTKNNVLIDTAGSFAHSSGVENLGFAFNSQDATPWRFRVASLAKQPSVDAKDGDQVTLIAEDGAVRTFTKSGDLYLESDFGKGCCSLSYDEDSHCWICYNPENQQRHVYNASGQLVAKYQSGQDTTQYSYDDSGRLKVITPPGSDDDSKSYHIDYVTNDDGTETCTLSVVTADETIKLRAYHFNKDKLVDSIVVYPHGSTASSDSFVEYHVAISYHKCSDGSWGIDTISQDDGSVYSCGYNDDGSLSEFTAGDDEPYQITLSTDAASSKTTVTIGDGMSVDITQNAQGQIVQLDSDKGFESRNGQLTQKFAYSSNRLQTKTEADGTVTTWEYDDSETVSHGLVTAVTRAGQATHYEHTVMQGRAFVSSVSTLQAEGGAPQVRHFVYEELGANDHYSSDTCIGLAFEVSPSGRVAAYEQDEDIGLPNQVRRFTEALYTGDIALDDMEAWAETQYKAKAYAVTEREYLEGSKLVAQLSRYEEVDEFGFGVPDENCSVVKRDFDDLLRSKAVTTTLSYEKDASGTYQPVNRVVNREQDSFGHRVNESYTDKKVDEVAFWQTQQFKTDDQLIQTKAEYHYNPDSADRCIQKVVDLPNGRVDTECYNEHGWLLKTASTDSAGTNRAAEFDYDSIGRPTLHTKPTGKIVWTVYNKQNRVGFEVDEDGHVTETVYDAAHRYRRVTHYQKPIKIPAGTAFIPGDYIQGQLVDIADADNDRTSYQFFDARKNPIYTIDDKNYVVERRYNLKNKLASKIAYKKPISAATIASLTAGEAVDLGGPTDTTVIGPATNDDYEVSSFYYDADDMLVLSIDPDGYCESIERNAKGQGIVTRKPVKAYVGARPTYAAPEIAQASTDICELHYFNRRGKKCATVDSAGFLTAKVLDAGLREVQSTTYYTALDLATLLADTTHAMPNLPAVHSEDRVQNKVYNMTGKVIQTSGSDGRCSWTVYDEMGKPIGTAHFDAAHAAEIQSGDYVRSMHRQYSAWGEVINQTNPWIEGDLRDILKDSTLSPNDRNQQIQAFYSNKSIRKIYSNGLLIRSYNTLNPADDKNTGATIRFYDSKDRLVFVVDAEQGITELSYSAFNQVASVRNYVNIMSVTDFQSLKGGLITDAIAKTLQGYQSDQDVEVSTDYDQRGTAVLHIDGMGYQKRTTTDFKGQVIKVEQSRTGLDSFDVVTDYIYDGRKNKIGQSKHDVAETQYEIQSWEYAHPLNKMTTKTDKNQVTTSYQLDSRGLVALSSDDGSNAAGSAMHYQHDAFGRVLASTDGLGQTMKYTYDQATHTHTCLYPDAVSTQVIAKNVFGDQISESLGDCVVSWTHDGAGNVVVATDALKLEKTTLRNSEGQVIQVTDYAGIVNTWDRDNQGRVKDRHEDFNGRDIATVYEHDGVGRVTFETDGNGVVTKHNYDKRSKLLSTIRDWQSDGAAGLRFQKAWTYDGLGEALTEKHSGATDGATMNYQFVQDALGNSTGKITDPSNLHFAQTNVLNQAGEVVMTIDPAGNKAHFILDDYNRKRFSIQADGVCIEHEYDALGREAVQYNYAMKLPDAVMQQLTPDMTLIGAEALLHPYRGGSSTCPAYATEQRFFYDANGNEKYMVRVLRTDPSQPGVLQAMITENLYDDKTRRLVKKIMYKAPYSWSAEPTWSADTIHSAVTSIADPEVDRADYFVLDDAGQARFVVDSTGQVTERRYRKDGTVWLTIEYANRMTDLSPLAGITLDDMAAAVAKLADASQDWMSGSFVNNHQKTVFQFKGHHYLDKSSWVSLIGYQYDANDNELTQVRYDQPVQIDITQGPDAILAQFKAIAVDKTVDGVVTKTYQNDNWVHTATDELGNAESFTRDSLGSVLIHTDRNGQQWHSQYDTARRRVQKTSPAVPVVTVALVADASGKLTPTDTVTTRAVTDKMDYDPLGNVIKQTNDLGGDNIVTEASFDAHSKPVRVWQDNVAVDDGVTEAPTMSALPTKAVTVSEENHQNAFGLHAAKIKNDVVFEACIYDSAKRLRYKLKFNDKAYADVAVIEYRYNAFNEPEWEIKYANRLQLNGDWNEDWFSKIPVQFLEQIGTVTPCADDRVTYTSYNQSGLPQAVYSGLDITKTDPEKGTFVGLVPYVANYGDKGTQYGMGYSEKQREFKIGKVVSEAKVVDLSATPVLSRKLRWHTPTGKIAAEAIPMQTKLNEPITYTIKRSVFNTRDKEMTCTKYATPMSAEDLAGITSLAALDTYLALHTSPGDRVTSYEYELRGFLTRVTRKNVTRYELDLSSGKPVPKKLTGELREDTSYGKLGKKQTETRPYFPSTDPAVDPTVGKRSYYARDARGNVVAAVNAPVNSGDNALTPMTQYGLNAAGKRVREQTFPEGADPSTVAAGAIPVAKDPTSADNPVKLTALDTLGNVQARKDPMGHVTLFTTTEEGKQARSYGEVSQWQEASGTYTTTVVIDEDRTKSDRHGNSVAKETYRDGAFVEGVYQAYSAFGEEISEGDDPAHPQLFNRYDVLGNLRISNAIARKGKRGVTQVFQVDLLSHETQAIVSAADNFGDLTIAGLYTPDLTNPEKTSVYGRAGIEVEQYFPSVGKGRVLQKILPTTKMGFSKGSMPIPVEMFAQVVSSEPDAVTFAPVLRWPKTTIGNLQPQITLTDGANTYKDLPIEDKGDHCEIDISTLPTGVYNYEIDYPAKSAITGAAIDMYLAKGSVAIVTANPAAAGVVIPFVRDDSLLCFVGDLSAYATGAQVNLYDSAGSLAGTVPLVADPITKGMVADVSSLASAHYTPALVDSSKKEVKLDQTVEINTPELPTEQTTWVIGCEAGLTISQDDDFEQTKAVLSLWQTLPPSLQGKPIEFGCLYIDGNGDMQYEIQQISPGEGGQASFVFSGFAASILSLNVRLMIDSDQSITLYDAEQPTASTPGIKNCTYSFAPKRYAYVRGTDFCDLPDGYKITYEDVSKSLQATNVNMAGELNPKGVAFNITNFQPGVYPFAKAGDDMSKPPYQLNLTQGGMIGVSASKLQRPEEWSDPDPKAPNPYVYERNAFYNIVSMTDPLGHTYTFTYNERDKEVSRTNPPVAKYDANFKLLQPGDPGTVGTQYVYRDTCDNVIAHQTPEGRVQGVACDVHGNPLSIVSGMGEHVVDLTYDAMSREHIRSQYGHDTTITHDLNSNAVDIEQPIDDGTKTIHMVQGFDEKKRLNLTVNGSGYPYHYNYGAKRDIVDRWNPMHYRWTYQWYRHTVTDSTRPDEKAKTQKWTASTPFYKYVGIYDQYTDLGGSQISKTYDQKLQLRTKKSTGVTNRGKYVMQIPHNVEGRSFLDYELKMVDQLEQDIEITWSGDYIWQRIDNSTGYGQVSDFDVMNRETYLKLYRIADGSIVSERRREIDALGRDSINVDGDMAVENVYDLDGNVVHTLAARDGTKQADYYYSYNDAGRINVAEGLLHTDAQGKTTIVTQSGQGFILGYDQYGRRNSEQYYSAGTNTYAYTPDGLIHTKTTPDNGTTTFTYDDSRWLVSIENPDKQGDDKYYKITYTYNADGTQATQTSLNHVIIGWKTDPKTGARVPIHQTSNSTTFSYNDAHLPNPTGYVNGCGEVQSLSVKDWTQNANYTYGYTYVFFGGQAEVYEVRAWTNDDYGAGYSSSLITRDPNGVANSKNGTQKAGDSGYTPNTVVMTPSMDGEIVEEVTFPQLDYSVSDDVRMPSDDARYYYDIKGNFLGSYNQHTISDEWPYMGFFGWGYPRYHKIHTTGKAKSLSSVKKGLNNLDKIDRSIMDMVSKFGPDYVYNLERDVIRGEMLFDTIGYECSNMAFPESKAQALLSAYNGNARTKSCKVTEAPYHDVVETIENLKPWNNPRSVVVASGDSLQSLSQTRLGDEAGVLALAEANNFSVAQALDDTDPNPPAPTVSKMGMFKQPPAKQDLMPALSGGGEKAPQAPSPEVEKKEQLLDAVSKLVKQLKKGGKFKPSTEFAANIEKLVAAHKDQLGSAKSALLDLNRRRGWYNDDQINLLLGGITAEKPGVIALTPMHLNRDNGDMVRQNLHERIADEIRVRSESGESLQKMLVPLNLGRNHWVALFVEFQDENYASPRVRYIDPLGQPVSVVFKSAIETAFAGPVQMEVERQRLQSDGYNCGPWIVEIFRSLLDTDGLPSADFDIRAAREHNWPFIEHLMRDEQSDSSNNLLTPGMEITLPQFVSSHNTAKTRTPADQFMSALIGSLTPHLEWAQPPSHWWDAILEIFIDIVAVFISSLMGPEAGLLMKAAVSAFSDAVLQGIACSVGILSHFSLADVIMAGIDGGIGKASGFSKWFEGLKDVKDIAKMSNLLELVTESIAQDLETQLIQLATHERKKLNFKEILESVADAVVDSRISIPVAKGTVLASEKIMNDIENSLIHGFSHELISDAVMGTDFNLLNVLSSAMEELMLDASGALQDKVKQHFHDEKFGLKGSVAGDDAHKAGVQKQSRGDVDDIRKGEKGHHDSEYQQDKAKKSVKQAKDAKTSDVVKKKMDENKKASHFDKSSAASKLPGRAAEYKKYQQYKASHPTTKMSFEEYRKKLAAVGVKFLKHISTHQLEEAEKELAKLVKKDPSLVNKLAKGELSGILDGLGLSYGILEAAVDGDLHPIKKGAEDLIGSKVLHKMMESAVKKIVNRVGVKGSVEWEDPYTWVSLASDVIDAFYSEKGVEMDFVSGMKDLFQGIDDIRHLDPFGAYSSMQDAEFELELGLTRTAAHVISSTADTVVDGVGDFADFVYNRMFHPVKAHEQVWAAIDAVTNEVHKVSIFATAKVEQAAHFTGESMLVASQVDGPPTLYMY